MRFVSQSTLLWSYGSRHSRELLLILDFFFSAPCAHVCGSWQEGKAEWQAQILPLFFHSVSSCQEILLSPQWLPYPRQFPTHPQPPRIHTAHVSSWALQHASWYCHLPTVGPWKPKPSLWWHRSAWPLPSHLAPTRSLWLNKRLMTYSIFQRAFLTSICTLHPVSNCFEFPTLNKYKD